MYIELTSINDVIVNTSEKFIMVEHYCYQLDKFCVNAFNCRYKMDGISLTQKKELDSDIQHELSDNRTCLEE